MPICRFCCKQLIAETEKQFGYNFSTKVWVCSKCGYRRWLLSKEDFDNWEVIFAEQMKNRTDEPRQSDYNVFYSLVEKPIIPYNKEDIKDGCKCGGSCGGDCKCGTNKPSGGCSSCGGCK